MGGGGVEAIYRHHFINEQESCTVLNEGVGGEGEGGFSLSPFDVKGRKRVPHAGPGPGATPNGSHFTHQLIKQPYLHPSLRARSQTMAAATGRTGEAAPAPPTDSQLFMRAARDRITAIVTAF